MHWLPFEHREPAGFSVHVPKVPGSRHDEHSGPAYDLGRLSDVIGTAVHDPMERYAARQEESLRALGIRRKDAR